MNYISDVQDKVVLNYHNALSNPSADVSDLALIFPS